MKPLLAALLLAAPLQAAEPWTEQNVPHGTIHEHTYQAASLGQERPLIVYTPPGYDTSPDRQYPLLILGHGRGGNQKSWIEEGHIHRIYDNLIAQNKVVPAIILMIDGHQPVETPEGSDFRAIALKAFQRELLEDAIPFVEKNYRVLEGSEHRALAGFSMGGMQSVSTAFAHPGTFSWVGSFAGAHAPDATRYAPFLEDPSKLNRSLKLLWFACGIEDPILERTVGHLALLNQKKVKHEWHLTDGSHDKEAYRVHFAGFASKIFR